MSILNGFQIRVVEVVENPLRADRSHSSLKEETDSRLDWLLFPADSSESSMKNGGSLSI
jgi:hypothetical protein